MVCYKDPYVSFYAGLMTTCGMWSDMWKIFQQQFMGF